MGTTILSVSVRLYVSAVSNQKIILKIYPIVDFEAIYSRPGDMRSQRYLPPLSLTHIFCQIWAYMVAYANWACKLWLNSIYLWIFYLYIDG